MPTLPKNLNYGGATPYRGQIDSIDTGGVRGWAVNVNAPRDAPTLALRVGSRIVARLVPDLPRDDIAEALCHAVNPAFVFDAETLHRATTLATSPRDLITVCIDATDLELGAATAVRAGDLRFTAPPPPAAIATAPRVSQKPSGAEAAIDRLLVIPGLGCMADGWMISPLKPIAEFRLRLGGVIFTPRADATYRKARPDLLEVFPHADALAADAGFITLFTAATDAPDLDDPALQLVFKDGTAHTIDLPPTLPRLLGHTAVAADALAFFPALSAEGFFPQFAAAAIAAQRAAVAAPIAITLAPTPKTLVQVLPENRSDLFLAFETIAAACRENLIDGLTLVAATYRTRAEAPWHLQDLLASYPVPASLLALPGVRQSFAALPEILRLTGAKRFCYVAADIFLTLPALRLAAAYLRGSSKTLNFLGPSADPFAPPDPHATPTSRCFAWTTQSFVPWAQNAPAFLGGHYRDNALTSAAEPTLHPNLVNASRPLAPSQIEQDVNAAVYAATVR